MKCSKCGKDNIEGSNFCKYCRTEMIGSNSQTFNRNQEQNNLPDTKSDTITKGCKVWS